MSSSRWVMVILSLLVFSILGVEPHRVYGSRHKNHANPPAGLCETSVTIHGYKCQEFSVRTEDGYVLSLQRISQGRGGGGGGDLKDKQPVLLQHGLLVDGMSWLINSPDESLGFVLADNGYDVWIANTRGTRFSRIHTTLDSSRPAYWDWSWDELVEFDLPATVDFVATQTGQKPHYVGHSLGTLVALASFSQGKLVDKLRSAALLSPVAYLSHMNTALGVLAAKAFVGEITTLIGISEFNIGEKVVVNFLKSLCASPGIDCYDLITAVTGKNCCLNSSTVETFLTNEPQSTAVKNMVHLAQTVRYGVLSKYDYGNPTVNIQHYGQPRPPIYNLNNIPKNFPIFMSYGGQDSLADPRDVGLLLDSLKFHDGDKLAVQFVKDYAHADFIMGVSAKDIVYNSMIAFFKRQGEHNDSFDYAFIDADKSNYKNYYEKLMKLVKVGGVIAIDNTLWLGTVVMEEDAVPIDLAVCKADRGILVELNEYLSSDPRIELSLLSIGDGLTLCKRLV